MSFEVGARLVAILLNLILVPTRWSERDQVKLGQGDALCLRRLEIFVHRLPQELDLAMYPRIRTPLTQSRLSRILLNLILQLRLRRSVQESVLYASQDEHDIA